jgi:hypothetical protein
MHWVPDGCITLGEERRLEPLKEDASGKDGSGHAIGEYYTLRRPLLIDVSVTGVLEVVTAAATPSGSRARLRSTILLCPQTP